MTPYEIKEKQKILLDYSAVIEETDKDLLTLALSKYARRTHKELIQDSIIRSRELRKELLEYGIVRMGSIFTDMDAVYVHTDYGYVRLRENDILI